MSQNILLLPPLLPAYFISLHLTDGGTVIRRIVDLFLVGALLCGCAKHDHAPPPPSPAQQASGSIANTSPAPASAASSPAPAPPAPPGKRMTVAALEAAVMGKDKPASTPRTYGGAYLTFTPPRGWTMRPSTADSAFVSYHAPEDLPALFDVWRPWPLDMPLATLIEGVTTFSIKSVPNSHDVQLSEPEPYKDVAPGLRAYHQTALFKKDYSEPVKATVDEQIDCYAIEYRELAQTFCMQTLHVVDELQPLTAKLMHDTIAAIRPSTPNNPIPGARVVYGGFVTIEVPAHWIKKAPSSAMAPLKIASDSSDSPPAVVEFWPQAERVTFGAREFLDRFTKQLVFADLDKPAIFPAGSYKDGDTDFATVKFDWRDLHPGTHHGFCKAAVRANYGQMVCFKALSDEAMREHWIDGRAILDSMRSITSKDEVVKQPLEPPPPPTAPPGKNHA
jgi:hypothetical protein